MGIEREGDREDEAQDRVCSDGARTVTVVAVSNVAVPAVTFVRSLCVVAIRVVVALVVDGALVDV